MTPIRRLEADQNDDRGVLAEKSAQPESLAFYRGVSFASLALPLENIPRSLQQTNSPGQMTHTPARRTASRPESSSWISPRLARDCRKNLVGAIATTANQEIPEFTATPAAWAGLSAPCRMKESKAREANNNYSNSSITSPQSRVRLNSRFLLAFFARNTSGHAAPSFLIQWPYDAVIRSFHGLCYTPRVFGRIRQHQPAERPLSRTLGYLFNWNLKSVPCFLLKSS